tara:strand:- start:366 stop:1100 length:735 start_codon:yes stop_codon:yes gene_type:complete
MFYQIKKYLISTKIYKYYYYLKYRNHLIKKADKDWLLHSKYPSKENIDWILDTILTKINKGFFIELGAYNGVNKSNTYVLEKFFNWSGICIEPNDFYFEILKKIRNCICTNDCVDNKEQEVEFFCYKTTGGIISSETDNDPETVKNKLKKDNHYGEDIKIKKLKTKTLSQVLQENNAPFKIDFLSLDTEGSEARILKDFPFKKYSFRVMVIASVTKELDEIIIKNGYKKLKADDTDAFYLNDNY